MDAFDWERSGTGRWRSAEDSNYSNAMDEAFLFKPLKCHHDSERSFSLSFRLEVIRETQGPKDSKTRRASSSLTLSQVYLVH